MHPEPLGFRLTFAARFIRIKFQQFEIWLRTYQIEFCSHFLKLLQYVYMMYSLYCTLYKSLAPGRSLGISGSSVTILVTFFIQHFRGCGERPLYFSAQVYAYSFAPEKYRSDSVSSSSRTSCTNFRPRTTF